MDLSQLSTQKKSEEGVVLEILHPVTKSVFLGFRDVPLTITLKGTESKEFKEMQNRQADRAFKGGKLKMSAADLAESALKTLAKITASWTGVSIDNENELPCNEANAYIVYKKYSQIRKQVDEFLAEDENFLGND